MTISFANEIGFCTLFFEIELTDAVVQDMSLDANDALGQTAEEVSFSYRKIKLTDISQDATGKPIVTAVVECDFATLKCT